MTRDSDTDHILIEFNNQAKDLYLEIFRDFNSSIEGVGRDRDEYTFRNQREQYILQLQQKLKGLAEETLSRNGDAKDREAFNQHMNQHIADYVNQFIQKIKGL